MNFLSLILKRASLKDYDSYYKIRSEKSNLFWTGYDKTPDYDRFLNWYKDRLQDNNRQLFLLFDQNKCIGSLNIDLYNTYAFIGYSVKENNTGKGYGTFLVKNAIEIIRENPKIEVIKAWINFQNIGSITVIKKNGFIKSNISENRMRFGKEEEYQQFTLRTF